MRKDCPNYQETANSLPLRLVEDLDVQLDALTECSDEELLAQFCLGQTEAFGVLVKRYEKELFGYLQRYLGDRNLADDVFQNTFLQLYRKIGTYEAGKPVRPWLKSRRDSARAWRRISAASSRLPTASWETGRTPRK